MSSRSLRIHHILVLALVLAFGAIPMWGASAVIGSVAGSTNATVGGQALVPNTTLFSGDNLRVNDGAAVVAMGMGSRMVFGRDTEATFERSSSDITVVLNKGVISMYHPLDGMPLKVKVANVAVSSGKDFKSLGEVAMLNGTVIITSKEGTLHVDGAGRTTDVAKGKTIAITPNAGAPQGAGSASHHWTQAQVVEVVTLGAAGVGLGFSIADYQKTKDVQTTANQAEANAAAAQASAALAVSAAQAAQAAAVAACQAASPTDTNCGTP